MKIREFLPTDLPMIHGFFDQMSPQAIEFFNKNDLNRNFAVKFVTEKNRSIIRWLAEEDGQMLGYVFLWDIDTTIPWLGVAVREDRKRQGIGKKLVEHANQWAAENSKGGVLLFTASTNLGGRALYESTGFEKIGVHSSGEWLYVKRFISFLDAEVEDRSPRMPEL